MPKSGAHIYRYACAYLPIRHISPGRRAHIYPYAEKACADLPIRGLFPVQTAQIYPHACADLPIQANRPQRICRIRVNVLENISTRRFRRKKTPGNADVMCRGRTVAMGCALKIQTDVLRDPKRFQRDATGEYWCTFAYLQRQTLFPRGHSGGVSRGIHDRDHQPETG